MEPQASHPEARVAAEGGTTDPTLYERYNKWYGSLNQSHRRLYWSGVATVAVSFIAGPMAGLFFAVGFGLAYFLYRANTHSV